MYKKRRTTRGRSRVGGKRRRIRRSASKRSKALTKKIKSVLYKQVETKTLGECDFVSLNNNSFYWRSLNTVPAYDGLSTNQQFNSRFGQAYQLLGFKLDFVFSNDIAGSVFRPMMIRMVVIEAKGEESTVFPSTGLNMFIKQDSSRIGWATSPGIQNTMDGISLPIDYKLYKTILDKTFVMGSGATASNGSAMKHFKTWIPINKRVNCNQMNTGVFQQDRQYFCGIWMYDPDLITNPNTRDWYCSQSWKTYWKDP